MHHIWKWLSFLIFFMLYLLLGGYLFNAIECPQELAAKRDLLQKHVRQTEALTRQDAWLVHSPSGNIHK